MADIFSLQFIYGDVFSCFVINFKVNEKHNFRDTDCIDFAH